MRTTLLKERYRTYEGARKRAAFENGLAPGEYRRGDKARLYRYSVVNIEGDYRVQRDVGTRDKEFEARLAQY